MNSYDFFIYEFIYFMNSYMNSGVSRFQMYLLPDGRLGLERFINMIETLENGLEVPVYPGLFPFFVVELYKRVFQLLLQEGFNFCEGVWE